MSEKIRFALVGIVNTTVDFLVLFLLVIGLGFVPVVANIFSTSAALITSFVLNKKAVFRSTDRRNFRQFIMFIIVTLAGIWGLQGIVIVTVNWSAYQLFGAEGTVVLLAGKIIATAFSLVWNYIWYSRVIFPKQNENKQ